jgi:heptosyltransferase-2
MAAMLTFDDISFDCRLYSGYKPCRHGNECAGCAHYDPLDGLPAERAGEAVTGGSPLTGRRAGEGLRVLVIKTGAMGDVLRTTTLLGPIHRVHPGARVVWVTEPVSLALLRGNPLIEEVVPLTPQTAADIESRDFDLLICLEKEGEALALAGRVRASERRGFGPTRWGTPTVFNPEARYGLLLGLSDELKFRVNTRSYPEIVCEMAGFEYRRDRYMLALSEASVRAREALRSRLGEGLSRPRVGINTGCGTAFPTKQWTLRGFAELIRVLHAQSCAHLLLLGGRAEEEFNRRLLEETAGCGVVDAGCHHSLEEFFGVVDACDVVVTSDSLAMHIAIARCKWVVALFGPTSAVEVDLYDRGEKVITDFSCAPCYLKKCRVDEEYNAAVGRGETPAVGPRTMCMESLTGERVAQAVLRGLAAVGHGT